MHSGMACDAKSNQVVLGIITRLTAEFLVVNLKVRHRAAELAPPAIAAKHQVAELFVQIRIQSQARGF